jgi:Zn finger protein HypA/HybF involved in hydrogenase expression
METSSGIGLMAEEISNQKMQLTHSRYSFGARCPQGHRPAQQLSVMDVNRMDVEFYCLLCDRSWSPSPEEHERARMFIEASCRGTEAVLPPEVAVVRIACEQCATTMHVHCEAGGLFSTAATSLVECPECAHTTDAVLPGAILDIFRG